MSGTSRATELPLTILTRLIVKHKEVIFKPVCCIETHDCDDTLTIVIFNSHEEDTIVFCFNFRTGFLFELRRPELALVTVVTDVAFCAPWITNLDKSSTIGHLFGGENHISVS